MLSAWQIFLILAVVLVLFGAGRIPRIMKDIGSGMRAFKEGLEGDKEDKKSNSRTVCFDKIVFHTALIRFLVEKAKTYFTEKTRQL